MTVGNLLLGALTERDLSLLRPHAEQVQRRRGDLIFCVGDDVAHVTLPLDRMIVTLVVTMREGKSVEVATIGREGAVGGVVSQGYLPAFTQAVVLVGGAALRIDINRLQEAKKASPALRDLFVRYGDCLLAQVFQSVACNALHSIDQRCLRWLLTLQDRLGTPCLPVTHEVLAEMLGVRRSYITSVLGDLQRQGLIAVRRGEIRIVDRAEVERAACECHANVRGHFEAVLGAKHRHGGGMIKLDASHPEWLVPPSSAAAQVVRSK